MDIVVFDPKKKKKDFLDPAGKRKAGRVSLIKGKDGTIYAKLSTPGFLASNRRREGSFQFSVRHPFP